MDRDALRPALIGVVCVLAIALAAATLTSPVDTGGGGGGITPASDTPDQQPSGVGDDDPGSSGGGNFGIDPICLQILSGPGPYLVLAVIVLGVGVPYYLRYGWLTGFGMAMAVGIPLLVLVVVLTAGCAGDFPAGQPGMNMTPTVGDGNGSSAPLGSGDGDVTDPTAPPVLILLVLGVAAVTVVGLYLASDDRDDEPQEEDAETAAEQREAIGRAAGRAADRIEDDVDVENEVYRAWREMTDHLDVDRPESSTPSEFADAAVEAGMSGSDVGELTRLFEEVRYGGASPTEDREQRAVAALRRIEGEYAADDSEAAGGDR
ncbi:DUF4129 domain-containing protein [Halostella litorea]|uniref:DUF4129 domain-containing protein n=1 Tax=Halostella litorea TaxID=2528831 RepID=UPI001091EE4E|nr:DUF4129 domain-containing protein [Halostella litorea]